MVNDEYKEKLKEIVSYYGDKHQRLKLIEELTECAEAVVKSLTKPSESAMWDRWMCSELADVLVMVSQMMIILGSDAEENVKKMMYMKIDRTMDGIGYEKEKSV